MGLETATFVNDLVVTNPVSGDKRKQGDDHLRLLKAALKATFPNADKAFYFPETEAVSADFTVDAADMNRTFLVDTSSIPVTGTLPTLDSDDAGWECHFIKTNTGTNPLFIAPASGTLQSGEVAALAKCRRVIPGHRCTARWSGTAWFVTRNCNVPVGGFMEGQWASLPVGFELPNGQTLSSASTNYPEFYKQNGNSGVTLDLTGRLTAMIEATATRITTAGSGIDGDTLGAAGGEETHTLVEDELPTITPEGSIALTSGGTTPLAVPAGSSVQSPNVGASALSYYNTTSYQAILGTFTGTAFGSDEAHNNMPPTIIVKKVLVVE